ncbi:hypothetical protein HPB51_000526 [Rhipicephalus microplus]|uniref:CCHC-type domain-containing protein n=1 Tax=Rhipicephalus microplus TaxID=6941 RepID=A0A9J6D3N3_RHIMP|nr:hypothetical protein HPB51_000526 [Rhipicephalus microplus]
MTFAGRVPKGTTNLELAKAFLERFRENDLKSVQDFGGSNFEVTFRNKAAVDRFLADSATIKVKNADIRFEYRGLRTVTVHVLEYPADASDRVLSRALEVYGKVLGISDDNLTGLRIESGNRRARMELRSPVPNITDVDGHVVRCEYDGCVRLCRKCRLPGHERKTCSTPWCARCQQWGHPTCDAPCKRCGEDHPPHLCKQRLYSEATTRTSVPQVAPPTAVSAQGPGAPAPVTTDKGEQGKAIMAAPGEVEVVEKSEKKAPESVEALPTASEQPAQPATHMATQKEATPVKAPIRLLTCPRGGGREGKVNVLVRFQLFGERLARAQTPSSNRTGGRRFVDVDHCGRLRNECRKPDSVHLLQVGRVRLLRAFGRIVRVYTGLSRRGRERSLARDTAVSFPSPFRSPLSRNSRTLSKLSPWLFFLSLSLLSTVAASLAPQNKTQLSS